MHKLPTEMASTIQFTIFDHSPEDIAPSPNTSFWDSLPRLMELSLTLPGSRFISPFFLTFTEF